MALLLPRSLTAFAAFQRTSQRILYDASISRARHRSSELARADIAFHLRRAAVAHDGARYSRIAQRPGDSHLTGRAPMPFADRLQPLH